MQAENSNHATIVSMIFENFIYKNYQALVFRSNTLTLLHKIKTYLSESVVEKFITLPEKLNLSCL